MPESRRLIFKGRKIELALQNVTLDDGKTAERELVIHPGSVALVPMVDPNTVCLVRAGRFAAGKTLWEVPAGTIDPGETPDATTARELQEETGYTAGRITKLAEWWVSPGWTTERMHLYRCDDLRPGPTQHQPDERLEVVTLAWSEALRLIDAREIEDAKTIAALLICDRLRGV